MCCGLYVLVEYQIIQVSLSYVALVQRVLMAIMFIAIILVINRLLKKILNRRMDDKTTVYNLRNVINLFTIVFIFIIALSLIFANWYATVVSFGVGSLILGLALQNTFTSFFGWIYLLVRKPYKVGDRIKIGSAYGDVIRVGYLDTTLWEFRAIIYQGTIPVAGSLNFQIQKYLVNTSIITPGLCFLLSGMS